MAKPSKKPDPMAQSLPQNIEAERSVLGAILLDNHALDRAVEAGLKAEHFFHSHHQVIFELALQLDARNVAIDLVTVTDELHRSKHLDAAGGAAYLSSLTDGVPRVSNVAHYSRIVKEHATLRDLIHANHVAEQAAMDRESSVEVLEKLETCLNSLREEQVNRGSVSIEAAVSETIPAIERAASGKGVLIGTPSGYKWLDTQAAGFISGELVLLAARPSEGKTAFAMELAVRQGYLGNPVDIWSLETSRESLVIRMACLMARVNVHRLRTGFLSNEDYRALVMALAELRKMPITIDDSSGLRSIELQRRIISAARRRKTKLAIVDYAQLLSAPGKDRYEQITRVSLDLKAAAKELGNVSGGTLLSLAQLNRTADRRVPRLSDLKDSGQLEQDADAVIFIYTTDDDVEPGQTAPFKKTLAIAKQKNGPCGSREFIYLPVCMAFAEDGEDMEIPARYQRRFTENVEPARPDTEWMEGAA